MFSPIIRVLAFVGTELLEVLRQPLLLLALVLGPFLILLIFGLGHRPEQPPLTTTLVIPSGIELPRDPFYWRDRFGGSIRVVNVTDDEAAAVAALKAGQIDVAVVIPSGASTVLAQGQPTAVRVLTNELDPVQQTYIHYAGYVLASELNKQVIAEVVGRVQQDVQQRQQPITTLRSQITQAREAIQGGNLARARQSISAARTQAIRLQADLRTAEQFLTGVAGAAPGDRTVADQLAALRQTETNLDTLVIQLAQLDADLVANSRGVAADLSQIDANLAAFQSLASTVEAIPPQVLAAPFTSQVESLESVQPSFVAYYSPGVLALLLQHLAITLTALSLVRERLLGTIELYQVAPVSTFQVLLGKLISYGLLSVAVAAALTGLMTQTLGVPLNGDPVRFAEVIGLLIFASLGIGLTISLISASQENAVQYAMLLLLASVFFSGFFLPRNTLQLPATAISDVLPVTYGIVALQEVMLRGGLRSPLPLIALGGEGLVFVVVSVILLNRQLRRR